MSTDQYNAWQIEYFDPATKHTMIPGDTPYIRRHIEETLDMAAYTPGERLLEVGCGMGRDIPQGWPDGAYARKGSIFHPNCWPI
ncbi:MAG: hypothetical protein FJY97_05695 [candidate division Zixibacteria bacterium]|nr:hypothetical protein [candidate division Zixibacteria bacterium]